MTDNQQQIRELVRYALSKVGAQLERQMDWDSEFFRPQVIVPVGSWGQLFGVEDEGGKLVARLPILQDHLADLQREHPEIQESSWSKRDGHVYAMVPLEAGLSDALIRQIIDHAHAVVWNKASEKCRQRFELSTSSRSDQEIMDVLIDSDGLGQYRDAIHGLARPAILLRTQKSDDSAIPLGATKIAGVPDLPEGTDWPKHANGKPLAFLAQLNMEEVHKVGSPFPALPSHGILSLFSAWGWLEEGDYDPQPPQRGWETQAGWTVALHSAAEGLQRCDVPEDVNSFPGAAADLIPVLLLPNHRQEPPVAALGWDIQLLRRFDRMQSDYRAILWHRYLKNMNDFASCHLLGGYALFQQEYPENLLNKGLSMFMQIGSDDRTDMCWGDGGELAFYADEKALSEGRIERAWCEHQCG